MGLRLHHYRVCVVAGMTETLERYKLEIVNNHGDRYIRCEPAPDGSWVMFEDVAALQARVAELEEMLFGLLKAFEGVGFRIGRTHPPRTASYEEAEQHYATNYKGKTALFMYQQWCQWRLACMARAALEGGK